MNCDICNKKVDDLETHKLQFHEAFVKTYERKDESPREIWDFAGTHARDSILKHVNTETEEVFNKILKDNPNLEHVDKTRDYIVNWEFDEIPYGLRNEITSFIENTRSIFESFANEVEWMCQDCEKKLVDETPREHQERTKHHNIGKFKSGRDEEFVGESKWLVSTLFSGKIPVELGIKATKADVIEQIKRMGINDEILAIDKIGESIISEGFHCEKCKFVTTSINEAEAHEHDMAHYKHIKQNANYQGKWALLPIDEKMSAIESLGFTQADAYQLARLDWYDLSNEVRSQLAKIEIEKAEEVEHIVDEGLDYEKIIAKAFTNNKPTYRLSESLFLNSMCKNCGGEDFETIKGENGTIEKVRCKKCFNTVYGESLLTEQMPSAFDLNDKRGKEEMLMKVDVDVKTARDLSKVRYNDLPQDIKDRLVYKFGEAFATEEIGGVCSICEGEVSDIYSHYKNYHPKEFKKYFGESQQKGNESVYTKIKTPNIQSKWTNSYVDERVKMLKEIGLNQDEIISLIEKRYVELPSDIRYKLEVGESYGMERYPEGFDSYLSAKDKKYCPVCDKEVDDLESHDKEVHESFSNEGFNINSMIDSYIKAKYETDDKEDDGEIDNEEYEYRQKSNEVTLHWHALSPNTKREMLKRLDIDPEDVELYINFGSFYDLPSFIQAELEEYYPDYFSEEVFVNHKKTLENISQLGEALSLNDVWSSVSKEQRKKLLQGLGVDESWAEANSLQEIAQRGGSMIVRELEDLWKMYRGV
jgi:hypothetical protein